EETRYILHGHEYWDIRGERKNFFAGPPTQPGIKVGPGVLVILPPGMFHKFTIDESDLRSMRLFLVSHSCNSQNGPSWRSIPQGKK
ncbi:hypothetical protein V8B97DRAFT_1870831, partial [Scleroderma yunnanense]